MPFVVPVGRTQHSYVKISCNKILIYFANNEYFISIRMKWIEKLERFFFPVFFSLRRANGVVLQRFIVIADVLLMFLRNLIRYWTMDECDACIEGHHNGRLTVSLKVMRTILLLLLLSWQRYRRSAFKSDMYHPKPHGCCCNSRDPNIYIAILPNKSH